MLFNSFSFGLFLPITLLIYWAVGFKKIKTQNAVLLVASYLFYGLWDWRFLFLIVASSLVDYFAGLAVANSENRNNQKIYLYSSLLWNLGVLFIFKYYNFFIEEFALLFNQNQGEYMFSSLNLILPIGLSFYTFQTMSYTIDVYKKRIEPTTNLLNFLCFVSFFPQLVAGPIEKAGDLLPQFNKPRKFIAEDTKDGLRQILWGLFKKMVIADNAAIIVNMVYYNPENYGSYSLVYASVLFFFQIYGDFSGYSDIAIGTAKLFGFKLSRNFNVPYLAKGVTDFWQRWHITLTRWFSDYVYFPIIQKNLRSTTRRIIAILITMSLIGLWHGANWTFILFGLLQAVLMIMERLPMGRNRKTSFYYRKPRIPSFLMPVFTFPFIVASCILFRSQSMDQVAVIFERIFSFISSENIKELLNRKFLFFLFILVASEVYMRHKNFPLYQLDKHLNRPTRWVIYYIFIILIFRYAGPKEDFIYFQF
ncbi:MBOAT family O-acyltransferase [Aequorivita lipolytica]|uniref:MBOAT family protein n=1 Tax=Aequorivita lipolytica TaxID=153267 RepID=A0A5C6YL97_9FLAO|nr:MBOAT family O-acyltransferase [Aequorivita lipolytica]TXD68016.1 MBOAT family protein [Aequorivita lipolytica]SRX53691.1 Peptidoglycan O-acetyltransferase [Aequorivita lipolytica]